MFARVKKSGKYQYLQLVENRKEKGRVKQQVIATLGRMDELSAKGRVETLIRSLSRFSEQAILIITGKSDVSLAAKKIGPGLIFERLWKQTGIGQAIGKQAAERKFGFDMERAVFLTVLHRLREAAETLSANAASARDRTIRGHVFCSFLALVLRKELDRCIEQAGQSFEWAEVKQDLKALQTVTIEESGKRFAVRSQCQGVCGKIFQAVGVALPPTIREL